MPLNYSREKYLEFIAICTSTKKVVICWVWNCSFCQVVAALSSHTQLLFKSPTVVLHIPSLFRFMLSAIKSSLQFHQAVRMLMSILLTSLKT